MNRKVRAPRRVSESGAPHVVTWTKQTWIKRQCTLKEDKPFLFKLNKKTESELLKGGWRHRDEGTRGGDGILQRYRRGGEMEFFKHSHFYFKGTVSRKLRHRLLYIIRKLFFYTFDACYKVKLFCKDFRTIYV